MNSPRRPSIVIIDDHDLFRQGLQALLERDFEIRGSGATSGEASDLIEHFRPDLLILDVETGSDSAEATIRRVRRLSPSLVVFILTMFDDAVLQRQLLAAGATDYATKAVDRGTLISRLHVALNAGPGAVHRLSSSPSVLTQRELEVLRLVAAAASNRDVGQKLAISEGTVKRHLANVFTKLGAASRIDAVTKARLHGLL